MIDKYFASRGKAEIKKVQVISETGHSITRQSSIGPFREAKKCRRFGYFNTWYEAYDWLIAVCEEDFDKAFDEFHRKCSHLCQVLAMSSPEEE